jgi:hypothetical protein
VTVPAAILEGQIVAKLSELLRYVPCLTYFSFFPFLFFSSSAPFFIFSSTQFIVLYSSFSSFFLRQFLIRIYDLLLFHLYHSPVLSVGFSFFNVLTGAVVCQGLMGLYTLFSLDSCMHVGMLVFVVYLTALCVARINLHSFDLPIYVRCESVTSPLKLDPSICTVKSLPKV